MSLIKKLIILRLWKTNKICPPESRKNIKGVNYMALGGYAALSALSLVVSIIYLTVFGCSIYAFVLFVQLARRGIQALDLYIAEKSDRIL